jgi:hypothetical protein
MRAVYRFTAATVIAVAALAFGYISLRADFSVAGTSVDQATGNAKDATRESAYGYCLRTQADGCEFMWLALRN